MSMINVHPDIDDPFYRYKMPKLVAKIEGSGNGIKTVIVNMSAIAKALNRSPEYTTKFFGCELGAQVQMYAKDDRWIVNGAHEGVKLQNLLGSFIKKFVLCESCDNPETNLIVKKNEISQQCKACGHSSIIPMVHRLASYIANHPPKSTGTDVPDSKSKEKKSGKKERKGKREKKQGEKENEEVVEDTNNLMNEDVNVNQEDDENWTVDVSEEAVKKRLEGLTKGIEGLTVSSDLSRSESERADIFFTFVSQRKDRLLETENQKDVYNEAQRLDLTDKAPLILSELLFTTDILNEISKYKSLIFRFCNGNERAQRYLLGGFEKIVGIVHKTLISKVPLILMAFYENDLIDETVFRSWSAKMSKKYVKDKDTVKEIHAAAKPFMKWLEEAEEETDDEVGKKDDNLDVIFTYRDADAILQEKASNNADDEIDIDAI